MLACTTQQRRTSGFGVPIYQAATEYPEVAALRETYDRDYVHGDHAARSRYAHAYTQFACAHPNILPIPLFCNDKDRPCKVPDPKYW